MKKMNMNLTKVKYYYFFKLIKKDVVQMHSDEEGNISNEEVEEIEPKLNSRNSNKLNNDLPQPAYNRKSNSNKYNDNNIPSYDDIKNKIKNNEDNNDFIEYNPINNKNNLNSHYNNVKNITDPHNVNIIPHNKVKVENKQNKLKDNSYNQEIIKNEQQENEDFGENTKKSKKIRYNQNPMERISEVEAEDEKYTTIFDKINDEAHRNHDFRINEENFNQITEKNITSDNVKYLFHPTLFDTEESKNKFQPEINKNSKYIISEKERNKSSDNSMSSNRQKIEVRIKIFKFNLIFLNLFIDFFKSFYLIFIIFCLNFIEFIFQSWSFIMTL